MDKQRELVQQGNMLALYTLDADGLNEVFARYNPGDGENVNPIYQNPMRTKQIYQDQFKGSIDNMIDELKKQGIGPKSPILASLGDLFMNWADDGIRKGRVILVSDMMENSELTSAYRQIMPTAEKLLLEERFGRLNGVYEVEVRLVLRDGWQQFQIGALRQFWFDVFKSEGCEVEW